MAPQQQEELEKQSPGSDSSVVSSEKTAREAEAGKQDLIETAKKVIEALKAGGRSGITSDFGKPMLMEEEGIGYGTTKDAGGKKYTSGELPSIKGKITGEVRKPSGEIIGEKSGEASIDPVKMPGGDIQPGDIGPVPMPGGDIQDPSQYPEMPEDPNDPIESPENPEEPEYPEFPGPEDPEFPELPGPEDPEFPELPDVPMPGDPDYPEIPGPPLPDFPEFPDLPPGQPMSPKDLQEFMRKFEESLRKADEQQPVFNAEGGSGGAFADVGKQLSKLTEQLAKQGVEGQLGQLSGELPPDALLNIQEQLRKLTENAIQIMKEQPGMQVPDGEYQPDAQPKTSIPKGEIQPTEPEVKVPTGEYQPGGKNAAVPDVSTDVPATKGDAAVKGGDNSLPRNDAPAKADVIEMEPIKIVGHYNGEQINKDVEPGNHTVEKGDTLSKIAKEHLGPDATKEEIAKHVKEIAHINGIKNPDLIHPGQELTLPGHTADGGMVLDDNAGSRYTRWQDGTLRVENADQSGYVQRPAADGGYTEHHWGQHPDQNYELTKTGDGKYLVADSPSDVPEEADAGDPRVARARLEETASEKITDPVELAQFREDMRRFEDRAREQGMSPEQIAQTYENVGRLMNHEGDQPLPQDQRVHIAEQIMNQAADPTTIDQGYHNTCNVTTIEARMYTRDPAEASRMVADMATTGQFTGRDGTTVVMPANSMAPDGEASNHPANYGDRSHASQLFQVGAVNHYYQTHPYTYTDAAGVVHNVPAGGMRYEQVPPVPGQNPQDTGERLVDTTNLDANGNPTPATDSSGNEVHSPDLPDNGIMDTNNRLMGDTDNDAYVCHEDYIAGEKKGLTMIDSEEELNDHIAKCAREGKLPIIVGVHSGNEPFLHDSGGGAAGGSGGGHVVTITGYDPGPPARVEIDNQWGEGNDHQGDRAVSVHDLYHAMRPPDNEAQVREVQNDVTWDRAHDTIDTRKEFELLRLENNLPTTSPMHITNAEFDRQLGEQIDAAGKRWEEQRADGTFNQAEYDNAREKLDDMIQSLPPDRRLATLQRSHDAGIFSDAEYDQKMTETIQATRTRWANEDANGTANAAERQRTRDQLRAMLDALPEDRRNEIINNAS